MNFYAFEERSGVRGFRLELFYGDFSIGIILQSLSEQLEF